MQSLLLSVMRIGLVTVALFSCYALSTAAWADVHGRVVAVQDGDTLTVLDQGNTQHRIRVAGIDAPEKRQAFGVRSKEALAACAFAKPAVVETRKQDRYGRTVGLVKVGGEDCGLRQVPSGLGVALQGV
jgi:endonuclease YncB( thermonuclease family)